MRTTQINQKPSSNKQPSAKNLTPVQRKLLEESRNNPPAEKAFKERARSINEKKFLGNVFQKARDFIKTSSKDLKKNAKKIWRDIRIQAGRRKTPNTFRPGNLVAFQYNAKHKEKAYDRNPLVIMLGPSRTTKNLYLGLNLHWLPMNQRVGAATFFAELIKKKGEVTYDDVKPFLKKFQGSPILRSYYYTRVSKTVYEMDVEQYQVAAGLPSEQIIRGK
jgi:hypothetical protein